MYITDIKVNDGRKIKLTICKSDLTLKTSILFYSNGLAIWHGFPDIMHIKANNGQKPAILNLIELKFFMAYSYL